MEVFLEISIILVIATVVASVMQLLRQPLIIGHILTGLLVGPAVLNLIHSKETVELFSHIGIALLLFIIGLGLNPRVIREVGKISVLTGVGQVVFTAGIGFFIAQFFGYGLVPSLYISTALAFSSTIIILKLLSDKKDTQRLYGKIATGFLLVQDIIAVLILVTITALGQNKPLAEILTGTVAVGVAFTAAMILISIYVLPRLTNFFAKSQEFLFLFSIGWGFGVAALAASIGFSIEIGALGAGVALASLPYSNEIAARMRPLRDFFIVLFFVVLGSGLSISNIGPGLTQALIFSAFVLVGNPIIVMIIMGLLKFTRKTSFKAGLAVAQISEFSLILMLLGRQMNHLNDEAVAMVTLVGMITIALSTYMILYSDKLFALFDTYLKIFERSHVSKEKDKSEIYDAIMFGYKAGSRSFVESFEALGKRFLVVDYDPETIDLLRSQDIPCIYGDADDAEFLEELPLERAKLVMIVLSDHPTNKLIVNKVVNDNPKAVVIAKAEQIHDAQELYDLGATYVMMPHFLSSETISFQVRKHGLSAHDQFAKARRKHLKYINNSN